MKKHVRFSLVSLMLMSAIAGILVFASFRPELRQDPGKKRTLKDTLYTNINGKGMEIRIEFEAGTEHNHPTFALWVEDMEGHFLQLIYVTQSLATGYFMHGSIGPGMWSNEPGEARRPATLPYFLHKRGIESADGTLLPSPDEPIPDAFTGATPIQDFYLKTVTDNILPEKFRILMEINQPWDWNEYWNNSKYPNDEDYKTSSQPAVVYAVTIDLSITEVNEYYLNPIGHSHYSGKNGLLYTDLSSLSTALEIVSKVKVSLP